MNTDFYKRQISNVISKEYVKLLKECNGWIAGGSILSIVTNQHINDIDVFFKSVEDAFHFYEALADDSFYCLCETKKSIMMVGKNMPNFNLVLFRYFENEQEIFDSFDFTICKGAFDGEEFVFDDDFFKDVASRTLIYTPSFKYPLSTALRIKKYQDRGYYISRNEYIKILLQITQKQINSIDDLEEELCGIYGIKLSEHFSDMEEFSVDKIIEELGNIHFDVTKIEDKHNREDEGLPEAFKDIFDVIEIKDGIKISTHDLSEYKGDKEPLKFPLTVYKWVKKEDGKYYSIFQNKVEYKMNSMVEDEKDRGFNILFENEAKHHYYRNNRNSVLIKMLVFGKDDLNVVRNELTAKKVLTIEEIEKSVDESVIVAPCAPSLPVPKPDKRKLIFKKVTDSL